MTRSGTRSNRIIHLASISDIHLGHRRNSTRDIVDNLYKAFPDNAETGDLDMIFLVGDVFDDLLSLNNEAVTDIDLWIGDFLTMAKKWDISVRVLEGTPSHDWKQSQRFSVINEVAEIGADLKYVKDLSIEYIERYGISVLYVPDEWENSTDKTYSQVKQLLRAKGLEQVDFAFMHGQFEFQLPPQVHAQKHDSQSYLDIVKHLVFIGHVHVSSSYERIFAQGSFDRLSHGEEGPKGHLRASVYENGDYYVDFIENLGAKKFITVNCLDIDLSEAFKRIEKRIAKLPAGSYVRIEVNNDAEILGNFDVLAQKYPSFIWNKLVRGVEEGVASIVEEETAYIPITITRDNITGMIMERLTNTGNLHSQLLNLASTILEEVI